MSDDRLGDLQGEPDRPAGEKSAGERLSERDRTHPEPARRPETPRPSNRYAWAVGIVAVMVLSVILFVETIPNSGRSLFGPKRGTTLREFAVPSARGNIEGKVANVCQGRPCPEGSGRVPACELTSDEVVNLCLLRRRPLVLTFVFDEGADCLPEVDRTERVARGLPGVQFATVFFTDKEIADVREIVSGRGWRQPVGVDGDGAVSNLYNVGVCPTTIFARPGGRVASVRLGNLTETQLRRGAARISR